MITTGGALFGVRKHAPNGCEQGHEIDRFGIEFVASRGNGLFAFAVQRMRGHADDRDVVGMRIFLERRRASQRSRTGISRSIRIYVRVLGHSQLAATLAVASRENLKTAKQLKACLEHVDVVVVVFDVEHFGHDTDFIPLGALVTSSVGAISLSGIVRLSSTNARRFWRSRRVSPCRRSTQCASMQRLGGSRVTQPIKQSCFVRPRVCCRHSEGRQAG